MIGRSSSFLGVAVSDQAVACAEISVSGDRRAVRRTATFTFPPETSLETPETAGQALAAFLRQKRFTASRVVVGVPARWLVAVEKDVPPADDQQARATLRLQAEQLAIAEHGDVVFDFAGRTSSSMPARALLVGMLRGRMDKVERMMDAAGMSVLAVTSSGLALASLAQRGAAGAQGADGGMLVLTRGGGEMIWRSAGVPRMLRHVPLVMNGHPDSPAMAPLGAELRRSVAMAQQNGERGGRVLLLDGVGLAPQDLKDLSSRLGVEVKSADGLDVLGIAAYDAEPNQPRPGGGLAPALSLALAAAKPELLPVDFKHSRLTPAPPQRVSRRAAWGIAVGALAVGVLIGLFVLVSRRQSEFDKLNAQLTSKEFKDKTAAAQAAVDRLKYGRGFFDRGRPPILECLREITQAFREDEKIWATGFSLRENGKGQLSGKAADQKTFLTVYDRLKKQKRFGEVKVIDSRESDARSHEWAFSISFNFDVAE